MMLKCVQIFSPLVFHGKTAHSAVHKCNTSLVTLRNNGSTSLTTCPQHAPFYLLAATRARTSCGFLQQQGRRISTSFKHPLRRLEAPAFTHVKNVNGAVWPRSSSDSFNKPNSAASLNRITRKPYTSARVQEASQACFRGGIVAPSWLLFGLCICAYSAGAASGFFGLKGPASAEALARRSTLPAAASSSRSSASESEAASHGKKVYFDYHVTGEVMTPFGDDDDDDDDDAGIGVPGDGRCLFRAVAHGACLKSGRPAPDESTQRQMADDLRNKALDELVRRRESSEWFIEGDFDAYVRRMRLPHTWGGEPELLMLSNVLRMPITVYMKDKGGIISIAEYGQEFGASNPIRVLYHGFGHYEALHFPEDTPMSRLSYCSGSSSKTYPTRRKR